MIFSQVSCCSKDKILKWHSISNFTVYIFIYLKLFILYIYLYIYFQLHSSLGIRLELLVFFIALCWLLMKLQKRKLFDTVNWWCFPNHKGKKNHLTLLHRVFVSFSFYEYDSLEDFFFFKKVFRRIWHVCLMLLS